MSSPSVGIIGLGFVGGAVAETFIHYTNVKVFDTSPTKLSDDYIDVISQDVLFCCLPTPMDKSGNLDVSIVEGALKKISDNLPDALEVKPVILKSTLSPSVLGELMLKFDNLMIIHNPEFLTERSAAFEFAQSNRFIFGTLVDMENTPQAKLVSELFNLRFPCVPQYWRSFVTSSLVKLFSNNFFATKISLLNEFSQICDAWGVSGEEVIGLMMLDNRIGRSHFQVPGHDGKKGYGGHCFIKDTNGYISLAKECEVDPKMVRATWNKNIEVRGALELVDEINKQEGRIATEKFNVEDVFKLGRKE